MFASLLLILIYISFISLGLQDSLFGAAWPSMYNSLNVPLSYAGIISMIGSAGTVIATIFSVYVIRRLKSGIAVTLSVIFTATALLGFSLSHSFIFLCICAVPLGLGSGSIDAALNNYVALNYKARHMSWLHCFWGVGASLGPLIMSWFLTHKNSWQEGYRTVSAIQYGLIILLIISIPLWKKVSSLNAPHLQNAIKPEGNPDVPQTHSSQITGESTQERNNSVDFKKILSIAGVKEILLAFFCYCAIELVTGIWGASYLVAEKGVDAQTAARWISFFYIGITAGRFLSGFLTIKFNNRQMVSLGQIVIAGGIIIFILPFADLTLLPGLFLIGLGCAPIFPSLLHETPANFGRENSQAIVGIQMGCAYIGNTVMPPLFGWISSYAGFKIFPLFTGIMLIINIIMTGLLNRKVDKAKNNNAV